MACLLLVALLLSGCQIGNTKVVFLKPVGYHQVFKIDKEVCRKKEAKVYLTNYMNIYGNAYGVSLRKQKSVQEDLEQYVKDLTISQLSKIKCMNGIAKEQKIELTKEEEQIAEAAAKEYYESLSKEERKYMGASQSLITKMYSEYLLASKVYQSLIGSVDEEVSDDEARIIELDQIFVEEETLAQELKSRLDNGEDFETLAANYSKASKVTVNVARGEKSQEYEDVAFDLDNEEISDVFAADGGYYILKCLNTYLPDESEANKEKVARQEKQTRFQAIYDELMADTISEYQERLWEKTDLTDYEDVKTNTFFKVYESYFGDGE